MKSRQSQMDADDRDRLNELYELSYSDQAGNPRTPSEYAKRFLDGIRHHSANGEKWARLVEQDLDDASFKMAQAMVKKWSRTVLVIHVDDGDKLVERGTMASVKRQVATEEGIRVEHQDILYVYADREDLLQMLNSTRAQIRSLRVNERIQMALLELMDNHPEATIVQEALDAEGTDLQTYLEAI